MRLVMIDNYDSFTYNLAQLFYEFNLEVLVYRHDQITIQGLENLKPDWLCISPGPKDPAHAGISKAVVKHFAPHVPLLGVCLGMQVINEVFAGKTHKAPVPMHGKRCLVDHRGDGIFENIPSPFWVARYHSLCVEPRSDDIVPVAFASDGVIMALRHSSWPLWGVQFHPESFLSEFGLELVSSFLALHPQWIMPDDCGAKDFSDRFPRLMSQAPFASETMLFREAS